MAATNFKTENNTFRKLVGNGLSYRIPRFQRDYSWTDEEWEDLWQDLQGTLQPGGEPAHYMGYLVLQSSDDKNFEVIDGQQRLTTVTIIVLAALKHLQRLVDAGKDAAANTQRLTQIRQTYIGYLDPVTLVARPKLVLNRNNNSYFQDYLVPLGHLPQRRIRASEHLLRKAFEWFDKRIGETLRQGRDDPGRHLAQLVEDLSDRTVRAQVKTREAVFALLREMEQDLDTYLALSAPDLSDWSLDLKGLAGTLRTFDVRQPFPLLLAAARVLPISDFTALVRACVVISLRYNIICGHSPAEQERTYNAVSERIARGDLGQLGGILTALAGVYPDDEAFRAAFSERSIRTTQSRNNRVVLSLFIEEPGRPTEPEAMNHPHQQDPQRLPCIDVLKTIGSQLIVLHHLSAYGPMSDHAYVLLPGVMDWLYDQARILVQIFLVSGGFLAAHSLAPDGCLRTPTPLLSLLRRYITLAIPYLAAIGVAIACAAVARAWMEHESIPAAPTAPQVVAHALLLHSVLGFDSLSAGVWYVAIDVQLFALLLALLWLGRRWPNSPTQAVSVVLVTGLTAASLYVFNRNPDLDIWGLYFFGAYGLGVLAFWASGQARAYWWLAALALFALPALAMEFRSRIALALVVALTLGLARYRGDLITWSGPSLALGAYFSRISYSLFLIHFPILLLINAAFAPWVGSGPAVNLSGLIFAWIACNLAGMAFHHLVESPGRVWSGRITRPLFHSHAPNTP